MTDARRRELERRFRETGVVTATIDVARIVLDREASQVGLLAEAIEWSQRHGGVDPAALREAICATPRGSPAPAGDPASVPGVRVVDSPAGRSRAPGSPTGGAWVGL